MKLFKIQILMVLLALPLVSCIDEIAPDKTEKEIITEISRTWSCDMTEDGTPYTGFDITISSDINASNEISISNFHNSDEVVTAIVGKDLMIRFNQQVGNQVFEGTGEISNDYSRITWNYKIDIGEDELVIVTGTSTSGGEV